MLTKEICVIYVGYILQSVLVETRYTHKFPEKDLQYPDDGSQLSQKEIRNLLIHMHETGQRFKKLSRRANVGAPAKVPLPVSGQKYHLPVFKLTRVPTSQGKKGKRIQQLRQGEEHAPSPQVGDTPPPATAPVQEQVKEFIEEAELEKINTAARSALNEEVFIEHKGYNDFLVIGRESDKFIEFVPNNIYYPTEKKCVNWLTNCNQKGLQSILLHKITAPFPYSGAGVHA